MLRALIEGVGLGLATGSFCLVGCVPFLAPYFLSERRRAAEDAFVLAEYLAGRLAAYVVFGTFFGLAGAFARPLLAGLVTGAVMTAAAVLLLLYALGKRFPEYNLCRLAGKMGFIRRFPLAVGFLLGINVCPPFLAGLAAMLSYGDLVPSILFSVGFFAATSAYLVPFLFSSKLARFPRINELAQVMGLLAGLYFLVQGVLMTASALGGG